MFSQKWPPSLSAHSVRTADTMLRHRDSRFLEKDLASTSFIFLLNRLLLKQIFLAQAKNT